jgi:hypothetical protein
LVPLAPHAIAIAAPAIDRILNVSSANAAILIACYGCWRSWRIGPVLDIRSELSHPIEE